MDQALRERLFQINREFYTHHADSFSATRGRIQPGVRMLLPKLMQAQFILDVGCGNGTLAQALVEDGFSGSYLGVDQSEALLTDAATSLEMSNSGQFQFQQADLSDAGWQQSFNCSPVSWLVSFATLHHLPDDALRTRTVQAFAQLAGLDGRVAVSVWQWQNSPHLQKRIVPWEKVDIDPSGLDEGDVLLDWRAGDQVGWRYVHTFSAASLRALAESAGFTVVESFYSDGQSGNLALYQVWRLRSEA